MEGQYFNHPLVDLHYYKFGQGSKIMLCFHGYGMHGKQFKLLEGELGAQYTFYGFDLFFHKGTKIRDNSLQHVKKGLSKTDLCGLIADFCDQHSIDRFSVIGYSMGTHYATALAELLPHRIIEYIVIAPSCLKPGATLLFLSRNRFGNKVLEKMALSQNGMLRMLKVCRQLKIIDDKAHQILFKEIATPELRFGFYACATYLRLLHTDIKLLIKSLNSENVRSIFIFGSRDAMYPPSIGNRVIPKLANGEIIVLDESHEIINRSLVRKLTEVLL